jgi:molybdate transport system substrate-binding protein
MMLVRCLILACSLWSSAACAETLTVAAASDLKFAMGEIVADFNHAHPADTVQVIYGSSGKFQSQIRQGAPYDVFFSADIAFPQGLVDAGFAASPVRVYAIGRLVLWSATLDASAMTLDSLTDPQITRIAIANPKHAPYGKRAEEALRTAGLWEKVQSKLVFGENIAHTAQFVKTGNAQVGIIALALAVNPELAGRGGYWLVPDTLHEPLEQGFIITKRAQSNELARRFADYAADRFKTSVMAEHGFAVPGEAAEGSRQ